MLELTKKDKYKELYDLACEIEKLEAEATKVGELPTDLVLSIKSTVTSTTYSGLQVRGTTYLTFIQLEIKELKRKLKRLEGTN